MAMSLRWPTRMKFTFIPNRNTRRNYWDRFPKVGRKSLRHSVGFKGQRSLVGDDQRAFDCRCSILRACCSREEAQRNRGNSNIQSLHARLAPEFASLLPGYLTHVAAMKRSAIEVLIDATLQNCRVAKSKTPGIAGRFACFALPAAQYGNLSMCFTCVMPLTV